MAGEQIFSSQAEFEVSESMRSGHVRSISPALPPYNSIIFSFLDLLPKK